MENIQDSLGGPDQATATTAAAAPQVTLSVKDVTHNVYAAAEAANSPFSSCEPLGLHGNYFGEGHNIGQFY